MTHAPYDAAKERLRNELSARIRECLVLRDWGRMEHWARQWIQSEPRNVNGFKWLARASVGLKRYQKAAYAYGRVLDFDPSNEEAQRYFQEFPSSGAQSLRQDFNATTQASYTKARGISLSGDELHEQILSPEQRRLLATRSLEMADLYYQHELFARASKCYLESYDWLKSEAAALGAARALHQSQQSPKAIQFLKNTLQNKSSWIEGRLLLGKVLFESGQSTEAQREWQHVLKIEPDNREALNFLRFLLDQRR